MMISDDQRKAGEHEVEQLPGDAAGKQGEQRPEGCPARHIFKLSANIVL
jgi:hypothetical protein